MSMDANSIACLDSLLSSSTSVPIGKIAVDYGLLREASSLLKRLPAVSSEGFTGEYLTVSC